MENLNLKIVLILTIGFAFASFLGYLSHRAKLSPILGYLFAGYVIGPYSPGYTADLDLAEQLAEIGVILMMFGVGLHFKWQDLLRTRRIAIPGALCQTFVTAFVSAGLIYWMGFSLETGILIGLAIGVASTVVLVRALADARLLGSKEGHAAVGWLIVEDLITIGVLLLVGPLASSMNGEQIPFLSIATSFGVALVKFAALTIFMFTLGRKLVSFLLSKVIRTTSHELFTLTILAITFVIAAGSSLLLGTSIALGAFIAGIVVGQTNMRQRVSVNATPLKDVFIVIFFLSIGMLFNPLAIVSNFPLFLVILGVILIIKPLAAYFITVFLKYPVKMALTIAIALAQIGEFSFIVGEEAMRFDLIADEIYDVIVACCFVSISINPLLFRKLKKLTAA